jgi:hypothetical protein
MFFVGVASKRVRFSVSPLDAALAVNLVSVAFKWVTGGILPGAAKQNAPN